MRCAVAETENWMICSDGDYSRSTQSYNRPQTIVGKPLGGFLGFLKMCPGENERVSCI